MRGRWAEAVTAWSDLIASDPPDSVLPGAYLEYAQALDRSGDTLGAVLALEELRVRFPERHESDSGDAMRRQLLEMEPSLEPAYEREVPRLAARWSNWRGPGGLASRPPGDEESPRPAVLADSERPVTGGAQ